MKAPRYLPLALLLLFSVGLPGAQADEPAGGRVHIYNWYDYIAPDTIKNFQQATGISAAYDVFDNSDVMQGKLMAGRSGYDVVVASGDLLPNLIKAGVLKKL
ncbi:spermidine/putrescine ABC transporter substrate-binding protein PotF, partial [Serratia proteamaculans]